MSVIAVPLAFSGGAAAAVTNNDASFDREVTDGSTVYQGQELIGDVDSYPDADQSNLELRRFNTEGNDEVGGLVSALNVVTDGSNEDYVTIDTTNRNAGQYIITNLSSGDKASNDPYSIQFEVVEQDLDVSFEDDEVADSGTNSETTFSVESDARNNYAINVTSESLDGSELYTVFNQSSSADLGPDLSSYDTTQYEVAQNVSSGQNTGYAIIDADEEVLTIYGGEADHTVDFDGIDTGDYDFNVEVIDSTAADNASTSVVDEGDGSVDFVDSNVEQQQGDIAEITLTPDNTDSGTLVIGDKDDVGYQANVSITDFAGESEVTIYFNTYAAGETDLGPVVWKDSDSDATVEFDETQNQTTSITSVLESGDYELTASAATSGGSDYSDRFEATLEEPDNVGSLFIQQRSTDSNTIWTASTSNVDEILSEDSDQQVDAVRSAIENDDITQADAVAHDDYAIHQVQASGLKGLFEWAEATGQSSLETQLIELTNSSNATFQNPDSAADAPLELRVRETRSSVGPNANLGTVNLSATNSQSSDALVVLHDDEEDEYFIMLETNNIRIDKNGRTRSLAADTDYEFDVRFQVRDDRLLGYDSEENDEVAELYQSVTTQHDVVERDGSFDVSSDDLVEVEAADGVEISGTTNIAPGSEVRIRTRGTGDARFSKSQSEIRVNSDGTFAGEFDFSDRNVDDEFTATLSSVVTTDDDPTADGIVIETVEEPDDEDAPEEPEDGNETDMDDSTDDSMDDMDDSTDDSMEENESTDNGTDVEGESSDDTPGFGALVALVAVLGAALLATRRQN